MTGKSESLEQRAEALVESQFQLIQSLIAARIQMGLSQETVGIRMGVSQPSVAAFESLDSNPTLSTIRRYALAVGVHIAHQVTHSRKVAVRRRTKTSA
jgi:transcriptional regulator with XRE-family HTH domain